MVTLSFQCLIAVYRNSCWLSVESLYIVFVMNGDHCGGFLVFVMKGDHCGDHPIKKQKIFHKIQWSMCPEGSKIQAWYFRQACIYSAWASGMELLHYNAVIMSAMASQITSLTFVYSSVYSGADQRKHQSSASRAFVRGNHRSPVNSPRKGPVTRKMFPFDDVIMLPKEIRLCDEAETFKRTVKTHLFIKFVNESTLAI